MFDLREVSWIVAVTRIALSLVVTAGALIGLNTIIFLNATNSSYSERVALAFQDAYDYGYSQTFDVAYQQARQVSFEKGYSKGYEISRDGIGSVPASRMARMSKPTYAELMDFLAQDSTDSNPYIDGAYVCFDYAADLNNAADAAGFPAAYVRLRSDDWGHAIVAFETADKGLVYIEPQSDKEVTIQLGKPYPWQQVGATSPLSAIDPILEMELIW